jgi:transglutaminase-like putative cysteine protease
MAGGRTRVPVIVTSLLLLAAAGAIAGFRLHSAGYDFGFLVPEIVWDVTLTQTATGHGSAVSLKTFLPQSDDRQTVLSESNLPSEFEYHARIDGYNRIGEWKASGLRGERVVSHGYRVRIEAVEYNISPDFKLGDTQYGSEKHLVEPTEAIQSTAPEIVALSTSLVPEDLGLLSYVQAAFDRVQSLGFKPFKGTTDALTALRLGEASCNGRGRLFAALMRAQGIPARLVGGLVLEPGEKRTSHQWVEIRAGGNWIPMDPTNHHFAKIPHNYLTLYRGDEVLFKHTPDVGFTYTFVIRSSLVPAQEIGTGGTSLGLWAVFEKLGIPLDLLKVVIMIPVGAIVVIIFRNVFGLRTFGTFLPVLIAASVRHTGIWWGLAGFASLLLLVSLVRRVTSGLQLLHSPQLSVLLTALIGFMLLMAVAADWLGAPALARVTLFPVAILTITAERFTLMDMEEGAAAAWFTLARTLAVVSLCYMCITSLSLQILMLTFPELLLVVAVIDIWLGRWMGMRVTEWLRFKSLVLRPAEGRAS